MTTLREAAQQALEALETLVPTKGPSIYNSARDALRAALAQQAEPAAGKVVAWGVFANIDGEWQLQHPVFAGDEQGKVNSEFERASYSGPQPLEVRPLGVVTATAQQAEPPNLADPAVQKRLATQWGYVPAAQAEPVEPVAWVNQANLDSARIARDRGGQGDTHTWSETRSSYHGVPLYAAPPQRKPLPKHDQHCVDVPGYGLTAVRLVRAVERAHGIKE